MRASGDAFPTMGHSVARYEGDVLVVQTSAFAPGYVTTIRTPIPQSEALRSTERFYLYGDRLAMDVTYIDPVVHAEPVTGTYRFKRWAFGVTVYGCTPENASYDR